jgi:hypothetical protein
MPVGPGGLLGAVEVLDSARTFLVGSYHVVVVDDSGELATWRNLRRYREVTILRNWRRRGISGLIVSLQRAYRHVLHQYDSAAVLRIDQDALITGPGVDADILAFLRAHPRAGMIGSRNWLDRADDMWRHVLEENEAMWGSLVRRAGEHGYVPGESVLGGAYVLSHACLEALERNGYLDLVPRGPYVAEDVVFSLLTQAVGFELHGFAGPDQPFAMAWRGLPMPPAQILATGKKVVHSVKFEPPDMAIRTIFARNRQRHLRAAPRDLEDTTALAARTRRLRFWLKWRPRAAHAFRESRPARARRILRRCARITPTQPLLWVALAASLVPASLIGPLNALRVRVGSLLEHALRRSR